VTLSLLPLCCCAVCAGVADDRVDPQQSRGKARGMRAGAAQTLVRAVAQRSRWLGRCTTALDTTDGQDAAAAAS
jgi:hypothetical protein